MTDLVTRHAGAPGGPGNEGGAGGGDGDDERDELVARLLAAQAAGERVRRERERAEAAERAARQAAADALKERDPGELRAELGLDLSRPATRLETLSRGAPGSPERAAYVAAQRAALRELAAKRAELGPEPAPPAAELEPETTPARAGLLARLWRAVKGDPT